jgi:hypothetical protein
MRKGGLINSEC